MFDGHGGAAPDTSNNPGGLFGGHRGAAHSGGLFGGHRGAADSGGLFGGHHGAAPDASNRPGDLFGGHRGAAPDASNRPGGLFGGHRGAAPDTINRPGGLFAPDTSSNSGGLFDGHRGVAHSGGLFGGHRGAAPDTINRPGGLFAPDTSSNSGGLFDGHRGVAHSGGLFDGHRGAAPDTSNRPGGLFAPDTSNRPGGLFGGHRGAAPDISNNSRDLFFDGHRGGLFGGHRGAAPDISNNSRDFFFDGHRGGLFNGHRGAAPDTSNRPGGLFGGHRGAAPDTRNNSGGLFGGHRGETSLNMPGVATANRNGFFDSFYTGEDHDNSTRHMPGTLWPELPSMPGRFPPSIIPVQPPMQAGGANNIFGRLHTGEHHDDSVFSSLFHNAMFRAPLNDAGPAPVMPGLFTDRINDARRADMRAGENLLDQLPDVSLDDIPNATDCNICMEPFGSTEDPESPVQLPCGHVMGRKCISRWLETSNSCPLCRRVLFGQVRDSQSEQEPSALFWQGTFSRVWNNLEPRLQRLVRSMTAQEQRHLLQALEESSSSRIETVQIEQVEIPGGSPEEVEAYRVELREISRQRAAIHTRLAEIEGEDSLLTPQRATELIELGAGYEALRTRLDNYHARINFTSFNQAI